MRFFRGFSGFLLAGSVSCPLVGGSGCFPSGSQGLVQRCVYHGCELWKAFLLLVGWFSCPNGCLTRDIPELEPVCYYIGLGLGENMTMSGRVQSIQYSMGPLSPMSFPLNLVPLN